MTFELIVFPTHDIYSFICMYEQHTEIVKVGDILLDLNVCIVSAFCKSSKGKESRSHEKQ